ncbi:MAG: MFS transporter [Candidatus Hodarchaeota archaeon]
MSKNPESANMNQDSKQETAIGTKEGKNINKKFMRADILGVILFLPLVLVANADSASLTANQVMIMADMGVTVVIFGWLSGLGILSQGIFTFLFGYLSDKYSRKWLLIMGGSTWALATFLFCTSQSIPMLFVARLVGTFGLGAISPVTFSLLSDMFPSEKRSNSFAWWGIATTIGGLLGGSLGLAFNKIDFEKMDPTWNIVQQMNYLREYEADKIIFWRASYLLIGILGIACSLICLIVKEPKRGSREKQLRESLATDELKYSYKIKKSDLKYIFTRASNFWLIFNFFDVIVTGFLLSNIILFINSEMRFGFDDTVSILQLLTFAIPAVGLGFFGQFYFSNQGDKRVKNGDPAGRVKVAIKCGIIHVPFFVLAMLSVPNKANSTFFLGTVVVPTWLFWVLLLVIGVILGIGLMYSLGIAPNWYASLIDVNLPEHRGTMLATAAFLDTIGRSFGAIFGGIFIDFFVKSGHSYPISMSMLWMAIIFGAASALMWAPIYKYCNRDFAYIQEMLEKRGLELKKRIDGERDASIEEAT